MDISHSAIQNSLLRSCPLMELCTKSQREETSSYTVNPLAHHDHMSHGETDAHHNLRVRGRVRGSIQKLHFVLLVTFLPMLNKSICSVYLELRSIERGDMEIISPHNMHT